MEKKSNKTVKLKPLRLPGKPEKDDLDDNTLIKIVKKDIFTIALS